MKNLLNNLLMAVALLTVTTTVPLFEGIGQAVEGAVQGAGRVVEGAVEGTATAVEGVAEGTGTVVGAPRRAVVDEEPEEIIELEEEEVQ